MQRPATHINITIPTFSYVLHPGPCKAANFWRPSRYPWICPWLSALPTRPAASPCGRRVRRPRSLSYTKWSAHSMPSTCAPRCPRTLLWRQRSPAQYQRVAHAAFP